MAKTPHTPALPAKVQRPPEPQRKARPAPAGGAAGDVHGVVAGRHSGTMRKNPNSGC